MEISARRCCVQALSHSNIQVFPSQIIKNDKTLVSFSLSLCDTVVGTYASRYRVSQYTVVFPRGEVTSLHKLSQVQLLEGGRRWRWGGGGGVKWCPKPAHRSLSVLTDSSLKHGPWSWSRCESEREGGRPSFGTQSLIRSFFCERLSRARWNDL